MSFNICSISGNPIKEGVIDTNTGYIYEKAIILKHLETTNKCPITKSNIDKSNLLEIKTDHFVKPRIAADTSIPSMLEVLQKEWDNAAKEAYVLRKDLDTARAELAHVYYQFDASTRVIAKLVKERDAIRNDLLNYKAIIQDDEEQNDEEALSKELADRITDKTYELIAERKKRDANTNNSFNSFNELVNFKLSKTVKVFDNNSITCADNLDDKIIVGAENGSIELFSINEDGNKHFNLNLEHTNTNSKKRVNDIKLFPAKNEKFVAYLAANDDATGSFVVKDNEKWITRYKITSHMEALTGVDIHPIEEYAVVSSLDGFWSFHNIVKVIKLFNI